MGKRKETSALYKEVIGLTIPIALQNIFSTAVSSADVLMIGSVSQDALSAVSLASQIQFVLNLIFLGLTLGTSLMTAQYWGKGDMETIGRILGLVLKIGTGISCVFALGACVFPELLMRLFTTDRTLIDYGVTYLRIVGVSYLFTGISQIYLSVLKAVKQIKLSTWIGSSALVLNVVFNALFLFGWFGLPRLGVVGIALGTLLARGIEVVWCILESVFRNSVKIKWENIFRNDRALVRDFWKYALPITLNGLSWGSAFASYSVIMGHLGSDVVAANSLATVARNFAMVGCNGLASGAGIYLGAKLGQGKEEEAKKDSGQILILTVLFSIVGGILILLARPFLVQAGDLSALAKQYLSQMLVLNAFYVIAKALNTMGNNGIFCCGGDTKFGLICDTIDMWCFSVPLGFLAAFVLRLEPMQVYALLCLDEVVKLPFMWRHYRKGTWANNITVKKNNN